MEIEEKPKTLLLLLSPRLLLNLRVYDDIKGNEVLCRIVCNLELVTFRVDLFKV